MTVEYSTALENQLLGGTGADASLKELFEEGFIVIYGGGVIPGVDEAAVGDVLCVVSDTGAAASATTGLNLGTAAGGSIPKASQVWQGVVDNPGNTGVPTYARWVQNAADEAAVIALATTTGATALRMQLKIGSAPASDVDFVITDFPLDTEDFFINAASLYF